MCLSFIYEKIKIHEKLLKKKEYSLIYFHLIQFSFVFISLLDLHSQEPMVPYEPQTYSEEEMLNRSRDFYTLLNKRRTVRFFSNKDVPMEVIENIVHTAGNYTCFGFLLLYCFDFVLLYQKVSTEMRRCNSN